ncbi:MAG: ribosomal protein S18-alanine N-acetyltransferase [Propionibacteriaceae bacterium]|jgi:ribosomal-protein-alanine N-acetyltransferase|nr:ribosomal protein S18-alanine N-acetyltransferase [Propionibacteriaceae bacterium]
MIRTAQPADLSAIMALEEAAFPEAERWSETSWREEFTQADRRVLVDTDGGEVRGVITGRVVIDAADVHRIIVSKQSRRNGIGRGLLDALLAWASQTGADQVLLEVRADNEPAIGFYHSFGFQNLSFRADYYGSGSDALVLAVSVAMPREFAAAESRWVQ